MKRQYFVLVGKSFRFRRLASSDIKNSSRETMKDILGFRLQLFQSLYSNSSQGYSEEDTSEVNGKSVERTK